MPASWITVVAAFSGAGASTVALALADTGAEDGRSVRLIESAEPSRSGLVSVTDAELGIDVTGSWRCGRRRRVTVDRRAGDTPASGWPESETDTYSATVVDLGPSQPSLLHRRLPTGARVVVVGRPTVPGVRRTEHTLCALDGRHVVVAMVGPRRWPSEVTTSAGPHLRQLLAAGRVVPVPVDRRLAVTGPTRAPLPRPVLAAGRSLLRLIDSDQHSDTRQPPWKEVPR